MHRRIRQYFYEVKAVLCLSTDVFNNDKENSRYVTTEIHVLNYNTLIIKRQLYRSEQSNHTT